MGNKKTRSRPEILDFGLGILDWGFAGMGNEEARTRSPAYGS